MTSSTPRHRPLGLALVAIYLPTLALLATVVAVSRVEDVPVADMLRDATSVADVPFYIGAVSGLGILLWCAAAVLCLFSAALLHAWKTEPEARGFLFSVGLLTALLTLDDAFLIHEAIAPRFLGDFGGDAMSALYVVSAVSILVRWRRVVQETPYVLWLLAGGFLALSIGFDKLHDFGLLAYFDQFMDEGGILLEDGSKLLGIAGWFGYFAWTCYATLAAPGTGR